VGCGISEAEVWQLCQTLEQPGLVILSESVAVDRGMALIQRLQRVQLGHRVLLLVQAPQHVPIQALIQFLHQGAPLAMVHVESFGTGVGIRALLALRAGRSYLDPRLRESLQVAEVCQLTRRESQTLQGLARGQSNKAIAADLGIKPETVRDHVSVLLRKLGASNRTDAVGKALAMGLIER
jgi:DNA-binding NarL/FixJ family response regulator